MPRKRKPKRSIQINNGHDIAERERGSDPDRGTPVVHTINRTQLVMDRLLNKHLIELTHWQAANDLRSLFVQARPGSFIAASDPGNIRVSGAEYEPGVNLEAAKKLGALRSALGVHLWSVAERLVYQDLDPRDWGKRPKFDGMVVTRAALSVLAEEMGM